MYEARNTFIAQEYNYVVLKVVTFVCLKFVMCMENLLPKDVLKKFLNFF